MKNAKPKKARSATAVDAYIDARIRERRHDLEMGYSWQSAARRFEICKALKVPLSSMFPKE
jgi:hypothetical protein